MSPVDGTRWVAVAWRQDQRHWLDHLGPHGVVWRPRDAPMVLERLARPPHAAATARSAAGSSRSKTGTGGAGNGKHDAVTTRMHKEPDR